MPSPMILLQRRIVAAACAAVCLVALGAGFLAGLPSGEVRPALAAGNHAANTACTFPDVTKTSALEVTHQTGPGYLGNSTVVEPDSGERWRIKAYWYPLPGLPANEYIETAYVDVDWNGSTWVTSNITLTANIVGITVCQGDTCDAGGGATHSWEYKLIVDVNDPDQTIPGWNLDNVTYTTFEVDDGDTIEDPTQTQGYCYTNASVSPTSQSNTAYDTPVTWPIGRCGFNCTITGGNITILYD